MVLLDHGKIVATGSPVQLKARHGGERVVVTVDQADDLTSAAEALAKVAAAPPRSTRKASSSPPRQAKRPA